MSFLKTSRWKRDKAVDLPIRTMSLNLVETRGRTVAAIQGCISEHRVSIKCLKLMCQFSGSGIRYLRVPSRSSRLSRGSFKVQSVVFQSVATVARLAHRLALHYALPGRLLLTTASRFAGIRLVIMALSLYSFVLAALYWLAKRFGWKDRLYDAVMYKDVISKKIDDLEMDGQEGMLRAVLSKTKANLASMSSIDDDHEIFSDSCCPDKSSTEHPMCPLCQGSGRINYEAKFKHIDEPCPRCLGSGHL
jgi:hypothetical protein